jgi:blue copper oxidase
MAPSRRTSPSPRKLIRLRLLNASTARIYRFGFADNRPFSLVGTDGGLLVAPYPTNRIQLSPAERAEIVVRMRPAERVVLRSYPPTLGTPHDMTTEAGGLDSFDVIELRAAPSLTASRPIPSVLGELSRLDPTDASTARTFWLAGLRINGNTMDMGRIDEFVTPNSTEIWEVTNLDPLPHNFHIHGVQYQVLTIDSAPPPPQLAGWKDTVYLPPHMPTRLIVRFGDYTDQGIPYMYHCHLLFHEDTGMMGQYVVVEPGHQPTPRQGTGPSSQHHRHR